MTDAHPVRNAQLVDVVLCDDTTIPAQVVDLDDDSDLAVLKIDVLADQLTLLPLADRETPFLTRQMAGLRLG